MSGSAGKADNPFLPPVQEYMTDGRTGSSGHLGNLFIFPFELSLRAGAHNCLCLHEASWIYLCNLDLTLPVVLRFCSPASQPMCYSTLIFFTWLTSMSYWPLQWAASCSYVSSHTCIIFFLGAIMSQRLETVTTNSPALATFSYCGKTLWWEEGWWYFRSGIPDGQTVTVTNLNQKWKYNMLKEISSQTICSYRWIQSPF